ncbi:hypothetical protein [Hymenobacter sp. UYP22]|uniref:hypothetical protein n=1 Tax=Hymenobacter sp. UYP22 TaxID=3156348 RepID=UPI00339414CB
MQTGLNQLVAQHFLPAPAEGRLRHLLPKDGNHLNVRADNLQWADRGEMDDLVVLQRFHACGVRNAHSKLTPELVREIRHLASQGHSNQQLATQYGVSRPAISLLVRGITWRTV